MSVAWATAHHARQPTGAPSEIDFLSLAASRETSHNDAGSRVPEAGTQGDPDLLGVREGWHLAPRLGRCSGSSSIRGAQPHDPRLPTKDTAMTSLRSEPLSYLVFALIVVSTFLF